MSRTRIVLAVAAAFLILAAAITWLTYRADNTVAGGAVSVSVSGGSPRTPGP